MQKTEQKGAKTKPESMLYRLRRNCCRTLVLVVTSSSFSWILSGIYFDITESSTMLTPVGSSKLNESFTATIF